MLMDVLKGAFSKQCYFPFQRRNFTLAFKAAESVGIESILVSCPSHIPVEKKCINIEQFIHTDKNFCESESS